jgi:sporulation protein YqfC
LSGKWIGQKFSKIFGIPADIVADLPGLSMIGSNDLLIRNYGSLVEFIDTKLVVRKPEGFIIVDGKKLRILYISREEILLNGSILSVKFAREEV